MDEQLAIYPVSDLSGLKYRGEYMEIVCIYCAILYKGFEHIGILVSLGVPNESLTDLKGPLYSGRS